MEQAAAFHSWDEYAVGLVCGAAYWAFRMGGDQGAEDAADYLDLNLRLVEQLLGSKQAWAGRMWRRPQGKAYQLSRRRCGHCSKTGRGRTAVWPPTISPFWAKRLATATGRSPTASTRTAAGGSSPGRETDEYANDVNNVGVYSLNTICNYDPDILPLLTAPTAPPTPGGRTGSSTPSPLRRRSLIL